MELLIATNNSGKIIELKDLLGDLPVRLHGLNEFPEIAEVEETGATFAENAALKAGIYAAQTGLWSLADDSGLEVAALGGAPGVFSARYGGENSTDDERVNKLLGELEQFENGERSARFVCAMTLADESGAIKYQTEGICTGKIAPAARGKRGFGYDPIFIPSGFQQTFGELSGEIKRKISHRALAIGKIIDYLLAFTIP